MRRLGLDVGLGVKEDGRRGLGYLILRTSTCGSTFTWRYVKRVV